MIKFNDIDLIFKNKVLFKKYNLHVKKGDKILFNSPSGSGKTSLFRMLLGFQQPDAGEILIGNQLLTARNLRSLRSNFAYLSQDVDLPGANLKTILDDIYSFEPNSSCEYNPDAILALLDNFKLDKEFLTKEISEISGGEKQRMGLIICSLLERPVWLLDEPTSALDSEISKIVVDHILKPERTVLVISHDRQWMETGMMQTERW